MLANVETIERRHAPPIANTLQLPPLPVTLIEAERRHSEIAAELAAVRTDFNTLNYNFAGIRVPRADGTLFPLSGRDHALADLQRRQVELEAAEAEARRTLSAERRKFGDAVTDQMRGPVADLCALVTEKLLEAEAMFALLGDLAQQAHQHSIGIRNDTMTRWPTLAAQLKSVRRQIEPSAHK